MKAVKVGYVFFLSLLLVASGILLTSRYYKPPEAPERPQFPQRETSATQPSQSFSSLQTNTPQEMDSSNTSAPTAAVQMTTPQDMSPEQNSKDGEFSVFSALQKSIFEGTSVDSVAPAADSSTFSYSDDVQQYYDDMENYDEELKTYAKEELIPYIRMFAIIGITGIFLATIFGLILSKFGITTVGSAYALTGVWGVVLLPLTLTLTSINTTLSALPGEQEVYLYTDPLLGGIGWATAIFALLLTVLGIVLLERINFPRLNLRKPNNTPPPPQQPQNPQMYMQ